MKYVVKLTMKEALSLGIVHCKCGHPPNNHFSFDKKPCAHCSCKEMDLYFSTGAPLNKNIKA